MSKSTEDLLNKGRKIVKLMVALLTGYCSLKKYMSKLDLRNNAMCRNCQTKEETSQYILCQDERLAKLRLECIDKLYPNPAKARKKKVKLDQMV